MRPMHWPFLVLSLALLSAASATTLESAVAQCPVDGRRFAAFRISDANNLGGQDRDLCPHALGQQPPTVVVWVCPGCGYAGMEPDFSLPLSDVEKQRLQAAVHPPQLAGATEDQRLYAAADKYRNALACYELLGRPAMQRGDVALLGSWACRLTHAWTRDDEAEFESLSDLLGLAEATRQLAPQYRPLKQAQLIVVAARAGKLPEERRARALFFAGTLYRSRGENLWAAPLLEEASRLADAPLREKIAREITLTGDEQSFQRRALALYNDALAHHESPTTNLGELLYRMGELHRRLGEMPQAVEYYRKALATGALSADLTTWAQEQLASVEAQNR